MERKTHNVVSKGKTHNVVSNGKTHDVVSNGKSREKAPARTRTRSQAISRE